MADPIFPEVGFGGLGGLSTALFGDDSSTFTSANVDVSSTESQKGKKETKTRVNRAAIDKIINDILSSNQGLADILLEEQGAGIFGSTTAQAAVGELIAKVAGEIGKLESTTTEDVNQIVKQTGKKFTQQEAVTESEGLLDRLF